MVLRLSERERGMLAGVLEDNDSNFENFLIGQLPAIAMIYEEVEAIERVAEGITQFLERTRINSGKLLIDEKFRQSISDIWNAYRDTFGENMIERYAFEDGGINISEKIWDKRRAKVEAIHTAVGKFIRGEFQK